MTKPTGKGRQPKQQQPVHTLTDGQLADEHRGYTMAKMRAVDRIKEIEVELDRRKIVSAQGEHAFVSKQIGDVGLLDYKRIRADLGDAIVREYALPGSDQFWRSKPLNKAVIA